MRALLSWLIGGTAIVLGSFFGTLFMIDYFGFGPQRVTVTEASYGASCGLKPGNFTTYVAGICSQTASCSIEVSKMGDPAPGCGKNFSAKFACYQYGPIREVSIAGDAYGQIATLNCKSG